MAASDFEYLSDVEFITLGEFDPSSERRDFDAISYGKFLWRGILRFERHSGTKIESRIVVYSDRDDPLGDDCAIRPGRLEEVSDAELAKAAIARAIVSCFDHTITMEALSDGNGGWITLETDT